MKISIISDLHFGFGYNSKYEDDCFEAADEAISKSLDCDLILICGDIFDSRLPRTSTWAKAISILVKPLMINKNIKLLDTDLKLKDASQRTLNGLPIIALHGNHERKIRGEISPVEALENAGILLHLNQNYLIFEKDGIKVAIHGMSNFSERLCLNELKRWNPKPIKDAYNILMLHQNIENYVYSSLEPVSLNFENLPKGFELIVNGHVHNYVKERINGTIFLIPGSLIITQFEKTEAEQRKGFIKMEIGNEKDAKIEFIPLQNSREFYYEDLKIFPGQRAREIIEKRVTELTSNKKKPPFIKLRIFGKETEIIEQDLREIERRFSEKSILLLSKQLESPELTEKIEFLRSLRDQRLSLDEIGISILKKNLEEMKFEGIDHEMLFRMLSEGEVENTMKILLGEQKTLWQL